MGIIQSKPRKVMINNEQYIEFEDWQILGRSMVLQWGQSGHTGWSEMRRHGGTNPVLWCTPSLRNQGIHRPAQDGKIRKIKRSFAYSVTRHRYTNIEKSLDIAL